MVTIEIKSTLKLFFSMEKCNGVVVEFLPCSWRVADSILILARA